LLVSNSEARISGDGEVEVDRTSPSPTRIATIQFYPRSMARSEEPNYDTRPLSQFNEYPHNNNQPIEQQPAGKQIPPQKDKTHTLKKAEHRTCNANAIKLKPTVTPPTNKIKTYLYLTRPHPSLNKHNNHQTFIEAKNTPIYKKNNTILPVATASQRNNNAMSDNNTYKKRRANEDSTPPRKNPRPFSYNNRGGVRELQKWRGATLNMGVQDEETRTTVDNAYRTGATNKAVALATKFTPAYGDKKVRQPKPPLPLTHPNRKSASTHSNSKNKTAWKSPTQDISPSETLRSNVTSSHRLWKKNRTYQKEGKNPLSSSNFAQASAHKSSAKNSLKEVPSVLSPLGKLRTKRSISKPSDRRYRSNLSTILTSLLSSSKMRSSSNKDLNKSTTTKCAKRTSSTSPNLMMLRKSSSFLQSPSVSPTLTSQTWFWETPLATRSASSSQGSPPSSNPKHLQRPSKSSMFPTSGYTYRGTTTRTDWTTPPLSTSVMPEKPTKLSTPQSLTDGNGPLSPGPTSTTKSHSLRPHNPNIVYPNIVNKSFKTRHKRPTKIKTKTRKITNRIKKTPKKILNIFTKNKTNYRHIATLITLVLFCLTSKSMVDKQLIRINKTLFQITTTTHTFITFQKGKKKRISTIKLHLPPKIHTKHKLPNQRKINLGITIALLIVSLLSMYNEKFFLINFLIVTDISNINLATQNVNPLNREKITYVEETMVNQNINILALQETKINTDQAERINTHFGNRMFFSINTKQTDYKRGGTAILISKEIKPYSTQVQAPPNITHIKIKPPANPTIHAISYYASPSSNAKKYFKTLKKHINKHDKAKEDIFVLLGDSNALINKVLDKYNSTEPGPNSRGKHLIKQIIYNKQKPFIDSYRMLHPHNKSFSHYTTNNNPNSPYLFRNCSRIDHILISTNARKIISDAKVGGYNVISDHTTCKLTLKLPHNLPTDTTQTPFFPKYLTKGYTPEELVLECKHIRPSPEIIKAVNEIKSGTHANLETRKNNINQLAHLLTKCIQSQITIPQTKRPNMKPFFDHLKDPALRGFTTAKRLIQKTMHRIWKKGTSNPSAKTCKEIRAAAKILKSPTNTISTKTIKKLRNKANKKITARAKQLETEHIAKLIDSNIQCFKTNLKRFYSIIKKEHRKDANMDVILDKNYNPITSNTEKTRHIKEYWCNLFHRRNKEYLQKLSDWKKEPLLYAHQPSIKYQGNWLTKPITAKELRKNMREMKKHTAPGPDTIPNEIWAAMPPEIMDIMLLTLNQCMEIKHVPNSWNDSYLRPIYKNKGDEKDLHNYRPICLLNSSYKIFTKILTSRLETHMEKNNLFSILQSGFRKNKGCLEAVKSLIALTEDSHWHKTEIHATFLDMQKAFDSVPHWALFNILLHYGAPTEFIEIIIAIYKNMKMQVITPTGLTDKIPINVGVRQGDILSPLLFIIFINPLLKKLEKHEGYKGFHLPNIPVLAVCDDMVLISNKRYQMDNLCTVVEKYLSYYGVKLNPTKSAYTYKTYNDARFDNITLGKEFPTMLDSNESYKYLGFYFNLDLNWTRHENECKRKFVHLLSLVRKRKLPTDLKINIINKIIIPTLQYSMYAIRFNDDLLKYFNKQVTNLIKRETKIYLNSNNGTICAKKSEGGRALNLPSHTQDITCLNSAVNHTVNRDIPSISQEIYKTLINTDKTAPFKHSLIKNMHIVANTHKYTIQRPGEETTPQYIKVPIQNSLTPTRWNNTYEIWAWTDGSLKNGKAGSGLTFGTYGPHLAIPSDFDDSVLYAELKAIELATHSVQNATLRIFSDSQSAIKAVKNFNKWKNTKRKCSRHKEILKRIHFYINKHNINLKITYVPSHFLRKYKKGGETAEKVLTHVNSLIEKFGPETTEKILRGNDKADNLAEEGRKITPLKATVPGGCDHLIFFHNNEYVKGSPHIHLERLLNEKIEKTWKRNHKESNRTDVDKESSHIVFQSPPTLANKEKNFLTKVRQGCLPTRANIHRMKPSNNAEYKVTWDKYYSSPKCIFCNENKDENTNHFLLECPYWELDRERLTTTINDTIDKHITQEKPLPNWVTNSRQINSSDNNEERKKILKALKKGNVETWRRMYFPKVIKEYITKLAKDKTTAKKCIRELQLNITNLIRRWYLIRCKEFHDKIDEDTDPPKPPLRAQAPQSTHILSTSPAPVIAK